MKEIEKKQKISAKNYEEALEEIKRLPTKEQPLNINKLRKKIGLNPIPGCDDDIIPIK